MINQLKTETKNVHIYYYNIMEKEKNKCTYIDVTFSRKLKYVLTYTYLRYYRVINSFRRICTIYLYTVH